MALFWVVLCVPLSWAELSMPLFWAEFSGPVMGVCQLHRSLNHLSLHKHNLFDRHTYQHNVVGR